MGAVVAVFGRHRVETNSKVAPGDMPEVAALQPNASPTPPVRKSRRPLARPTTSLRRAHYQNSRRLAAERRRAVLSFTPLHPRTPRVPLTDAQVGLVSHACLRAQQARSHPSPRGASRGASLPGLTSRASLPPLPTGPARAWAEMHGAARHPRSIRAEGPG
jgi:hypothetical protein